MKESKPGVIKLINNQKKLIKINLTLTCGFEKKNIETGKVETSDGFFHTKMEVINPMSDDLSKIYDPWSEILLDSVSKYESAGYVWTFSSIGSLDISINPFQPLGGSSYIKLPEYLAKKESIINVKNENDHECFKWAVI